MKRVLFKDFNFMYQQQTIQIASEILTPFCFGDLIKDSSMTSTVKSGKTSLKCLYISSSFCVNFNTVASLTAVRS